MRGAVSLPGVGIQVKRFSSCFSQATYCLEFARMNPRYAYLAGLGGDERSVLLG
jgi:hypothetical protein